MIPDELDVAVAAVRDDMAQDGATDPTPYVSDESAAMYGTTRAAILERLFGPDALGAVADALDVDVMPHGLVRVSHGATDVVIDEPETGTLRVCVYRNGWDGSAPDDCDEIPTTTPVADVVATVRRMLALTTVIDAAVATARTEIRDDIAAGHIPAGISSFRDLHGYVDANTYGGMCTDEFIAATRSSWEYACDAVTTAVDAWLVAGMPR